MWVRDQDENSWLGGQPLYGRIHDIGGKKNPFTYRQKCRIDLLLDRLEDAFPSKGPSFFHMFCVDDRRHPRPKVAPLPSVGYWEIPACE